MANKRLVPTRNGKGPLLAAQPLNPAEAFLSVGGCVNVLLAQKRIAGMRRAMDNSEPLLLTIRLTDSGSNRGSFHISPNMLQGASNNRLKFARRFLQFSGHSEPTSQECHRCQDWDQERHTSSVHGPLYRQACGCKA